MTTSLLTDRLAHAHIADLHADADRRRLAHQARATRRIGPLRSFAARLLVRSGLRLARAERAAVLPTLAVAERARSHPVATPAVAESRAPVAPHRRAA